MSGGGIFGNEEETLHPTQRFWNLKQVGSAPKGIRAIPVTSNKENVTCAAPGNHSKGIYIVHLVNNGPARQVGTYRITG